MAELIIKAVDATHSNPLKDQRDCYKRGMPVQVMDDGHPWGAEERLPRFVVFKFPLISKDRVKKYVLPNYLDDANPTTVVRRRLWRIRWADLPQSARNRLQNTGQLVIKATALYTGAFDFTWAQVKEFFQNSQTGANETADI